MNNDDDLDLLLKHSIAAVEEAKKLKDTRARLNKTPVGGRDREGLVAILKAHDETRMWTTEASVALIRIQRCVCGAEHKWFDGWMKKQYHRHFPATTRLIAGKAESNFPSRVEHHIVKDVHECSACVEVTEQKRIA